MSEILNPIKEEIVIIEFGANTGQFSEAVLNTPHKTPYVVHSMEPMTGVFNLLKNRSMTFKKQENDKHFLYNIGIGDRSGRMPIYSNKPISSGASLGKGLRFNFKQVAEVVITTLPDFIKKHRIKTPVSFVKIDVEGFEPEVIMGMQLETNSDMFPLFSFETGGTWRDDRSVLARNFTIKSFVTMLNDWGYDSFFIGYPYLLPISRPNWIDSFDGFDRSPNVLSVLRCSKSWQKLVMSPNRINFNSCQWK